MSRRKQLEHVVAAYDAHMAKRKKPKPKPKPKPNPPAVNSDFGTPELRQHTTVTVDRVAGEGGVLYRDVAKAEQRDMLRFYSKSKTITGKQREAGRTYAALDEAAVCRPSVIGSYGERVTGGGSSEMFTVISVDLLQERDEAAKVMGMYANTVISVVVHNEQIKRGQIPWLRVGLDKLVKHFGI
jgi:hypothetical protein